MKRFFDKFNIQKSFIKMDYIMKMSQTYFIITITFCSTIAGW